MQRYPKQFRPPAWRPANRRGGGLVTGQRAETGLTVEDLLAELGESGTRTRVRNPYRNSMIAHICIRAKALAIAQVPMRAHLAEGDAIEDQQHPLNRLIAKPNGLQSWEQFVEATIINLEQDGIVHWIDPRGGDERRLGDARSMAVIARRREMTPVRQGGILVGWYWTSSEVGDAKFVPLADVATFRYLDPDDADDGLPPHVPLARAVLHHNLSVDFNNAAMENGGEVGTIYETDQFLTREQLKDLHRELAPRHRPGGHQRFAIAHGGLKIDRGTDSLRDIDNLNGMRLDADLIGAAYGVPPIMRGDWSETALNNARTQKVLFWEFTGLYLLGALQRGANEFFLRGNQSRFSLWFFEEAVPELKWRSAEFAKDVMGLKDLFGRNEINRRYDLGFEDVSWGEEPFVGAGLMPISVVADGARDALVLDTTPEGGDAVDVVEPSDGADRQPAERGLLITQTRAAESGAAGLRETIRQAVEQERAESDRDRRIRRLHDAWNATWSGLRRSAGFKLAAFFRRQGAQMKTRLEQELQTRAEGDAVPVGADAIEKIMFDLVEENGRLEAVMRPLVKDAAELGGKQIVREVGIAAAISFDIEAPEVAEHLRGQMIRIRRVNETTIEKVRATLLKGLDEGETLAELGKRIDQVMNVQGKSRGYLIAQTELHESINAGRAQAMEQAGVNGKAWLTSGRPVRNKANPNGVVRSAHHHAQVTSAHGIRIDELYTLIDEDGKTERARYPGDSSLSAANRINCSCVSVARTLSRGERSDDLPWPDPDRLLTYEDMLRERSTNVQAR